MAISLLFGVFLIPLQAEAISFSAITSFIMGEDASASTPPAPTTSANMEVLRADVYPDSPTNNSCYGDIVDELALSPCIDSGTDDTGWSDQITFYTVKTGDNWSWIAENGGINPVSVDTVLLANDKKTTDKPITGEVLLIPPISGLDYEVQKNDTCERIASNHKAIAVDIINYNNLDCKTIHAGDVIFIPNGEKYQANSKLAQKTTTVVKKAQPTKTYPVLGGYFINPVPGYRRSQGLHDKNGVDLAIPTGTPIHASAAGIVTFARNGYNGGFGNLVIIYHPNGVETLYAHMSKLNTTTGSKVEQGQIIGYVGSTGRSTGPHLHFEVHGAKNPGVDGSWAK